DDQLFWVRPKNILMRTESVGRCTKCKAMLAPDIWGDRSGRDLSGTNVPLVTFDADRLELPEYGAKNVDLARGEPLCGSTDPDGGFYYNIFISGALYEHLRRSGVKGMKIDKDRVLFSAKGEPAIEPKP